MMACCSRLSRRCHQQRCLLQENQRVKLLVGIEGVPPRESVLESEEVSSLKVLVGQHPVPSMSRRPPPPLAPLPRGSSSYNDANVFWISSLLRCCFYSTPSFTSSSSSSRVLEQQEQEPPTEQKVRRKSQKSKPISIYEMDAFRLQGIDTLEQLQDLVEQLEKMPSLSALNMKSLVIPLARVCANANNNMDNNDHNNNQEDRFFSSDDSTAAANNTSTTRWKKAELCERILLACLSRCFLSSFPEATAIAPDGVIVPSSSSAALSSYSSFSREKQKHRQEEKEEENMVVSQTPQPQLPYPPNDLYNLVLMAWGNMRSLEGAKRAQQVWKLMLDQRQLQQHLLQQQQQKEKKNNSNHDGNNNDDGDYFFYAAKPDRRTYKSLVRAWAVSGAPQGPARSYELLREMERQSGVDKILLLPLDAAATRVDDEHDMRGTTDTSSAAVKTNDAFTTREEDEDSIQPPDRSVYNAVLFAYAKSFISNPSDCRNALDRILEIVNHMKQLYIKTQNPEYQLDNVSYHAILKAYHRYIAYHDISSPSLMPINNSRFSSPGSYSFLDPRIARDIHAVLEEMTTRSRAGGDRDLLLPDNRNKHKLSILSWAYGVFVEALCKTQPLNEHLNHAHNYLLAMAGRRRNNKYNSNNRNSNSQTRNSREVVNTENEFLLEFPPNVYPDQEIIHRVLKAWQRLQLIENRDADSSSSLIQRKIDELVDVALDAPFERIYHFNQAAEFWSRSGWDYAPDLIEQMIERAWEKSKATRNLKPTGQTFAIAMRAWLRNSTREEAPYRSELLLQQLLQVYQETSDRYYEPRDEHLRFVMTGWLNRCRDGKRYHGLAGPNLYPAEHIEAHLQWLVVPGSDWIKNRTGHYSMAIRAWAKQVTINDGSNNSSRDETDAVQHAMRLLNQLGDLVEGSLPAYPCNWCLEVCSHPQSTMQKRKAAYDAALETFRRGQHNARTFVLMIQVFKTQVGAALDDDHLTIIEELFQECCSCGLLSQDLIWHVVEVLSAESLQKLFGVSYHYAELIVQMREEELDAKAMKWIDIPPSALLVQNLPREWSRKANTK